MYHSYEKTLEKLSDQELGRLIRALLKYSSTGEREQLTGRESIALDFIAADIDRAKDAYDQKCAKNRQNILKRWGDPVDPDDTTVYDRIRSDTTAYEAIPTDTKDTKEKEKEKEKETYTHIGTDCPTTHARAWFDPEHPGEPYDMAWMTSDAARRAIAQRIINTVLKTMRSNDEPYLLDVLEQAMRCEINPARLLYMAKGNVSTTGWMADIIREIHARGEHFGYGGLDELDDAWPERHELELAVAKLERMQAGGQKAVSG